MTVTAPRGFRAAGIAAGLKSTGKPDLALVVNDGPGAAAAAVFTSNRCKANPILWSQEAIADGVASAIVLNSGGANCYTGAFGFATTHLTAEAVARALDLSSADVQVCSTGLIGEGGQAFRDAIFDHVPELVGALGASEEAGHRAANAILTTDSHAKETVYRDPSGYTIGAMAKGAGMLAPGLATMLVVITTDADLDASSLARALGHATSVTFDRLDSDGCMSTNDQVTLLSSGASGIAPDEDEFTRALTSVCDELARQLQQDAEGASHDIAIEVRQAASEADAVEVGRAVARNNLFKAAVFGQDPNWGRVLAAVGTTSARFDPYGIDVIIQGVMVAKQGEPHEDRSLVDMTQRAVNVTIDLHAGEHTATIRTNDLTHDYVHENSAYSS